MVIIHSGTNDITNKVNTLQKIRKVINAIKDDLNDKIEIVLSSVIHWDDQDLEDEINKLNEKLENLCKGKGMRFIDNSNIKSSSLNRSKLHLNKSGTALLTKNSQDYDNKVILGDFNLIQVLFCLWITKICLIW